MFSNVKRLNYEKWLQKQKLMLRQCRTPDGNIHLDQGSRLNLRKQVKLTTCKMYSVSVFSKFWNTIRLNESSAILKKCAYASVERDITSTHSVTQV